MGVKKSAVCRSRLPPNGMYPRIITGLHTAYEAIVRPRREPSQCLLQVPWSEPGSSTSLGRVLRQPYARTLVHRGRVYPRCATPPDGWRRSPLNGHTPLTSPCALNMCHPADVLAWGTVHHGVYKENLCQVEAESSAPYR